MLYLIDTTQMYEEKFISYELIFHFHALYNY